MDALKQYESDSEESVESEIFTKEDYVATEDLGAKSDETEKHEIDFFGLIPSENDAKCIKTPSAIIKGKTVSIDNETFDIDIPGTSFWKDTELSDLQILQQTNKLSGKDFNQYRKENQFRKATFGHSSVDKIRKMNEPPLNSSGDCNSDKHEHDTKRKLYFIHPKIGPHLHRKCSHCKYPTNIEWTNPAHAGATNRLKWNVPNYSHLLASCSMDSTVKVWNVWSQLDPCVSVLRSHDKAVKDVDWSQAGNHLLSASYDKSAVLTDIETGTLVCRLQHSGYVTCSRFYPVTPHLCITGTSNQMLVWDTRTPSRHCKMFTYKDNFGQVQDIAFSLDGSQLFSCCDLVSRDSADRNLMAWDFRSGVTLSNQIYQERYTLTRLKIHPSDQQLLAQSQGNYIAIFSLQRPYKMNKHKRFDGHKVQGYSIGFDISPDGQTVYSASCDGKLYCYNYQSGRLHKTIHTGLDVVLDVVCHPVLSSTLATCAWDGTIQVWK